MFLTEDSAGSRQRPTRCRPNCLVVSLLGAILYLTSATSQAQQQFLQPIFVKNMDLATVRENTPIGDIVYTLEAQLERSLQQQVQARVVYSIEGTSLFSVDKSTGQVRVAQVIDREQVSDSVTFQVGATVVYNANPAGQPARVQFGPSSQLTVTVLVLDENDNPPRIDRVSVGRHEYDSLALARLALGQSPAQRGPTVRLNVSESTPTGSVVVERIEALDVDKASLSPLRAVCLDCEPEFELRPTSDEPLNDRLNSSIVLLGPLVHVPRNNIRQLHVVVSDGKFNSSIYFELLVEDVQNKPPQFVSSTTCIVQENVPIDKTIMTVQAIDGDAIGADESISTLVKLGGGRQILYDFVNQFGQSVSTSEDFKLHPLTGQLQVANRLDRESYFAQNSVLALRVRARELSLSAESVVRDDDLYDSILERLSSHVDQSAEATSEVEITIILVDVNDNEPRWLNGTEIASLNMNQSPNWFSSLPNDRDTGRIYQIQVRENSLAGSPISLNNEMFVYDLDNGDNAEFNLTLIDPFNLFDVEPKQVSGFALVSLKLAAGGQRQRRLLDYENPNERSFIIQLIATETKTSEKFSSKAQVQINVLDANDNSPEFRDSSYHANIREDAPPGKMVLLVSASDRDEVSKQLSYSLHGKSAYLFDINRHSGLITVARCESGSRPPRPSRPCIDFEQQRSHHLMVEASDGELSSKVPLTVFVDDASDNPPVFTLPVVDVVIEEGSERLEPAIKIEATDVDQSSVLSYSIVEGNFDGLFSINNATGELQLTRPIRISHDDMLSVGPDYKQQQLNKMTLIIQATDGLFATNGTIRIDVLDANDNAPKFLRPQYFAEIHESLVPGQLVTTVRAIDSDRGNNAKVSYKLERGSHGQFDIDEATGTISVSKQARDFDASKRQNYTLEVVAHDHGLVSRSSSVLVHIHVLDTIRRPPEFEPQIQRTTVHESTLNNTIIHRMTVANQDALSQSLLMYEPGPIEALDKNGQQASSEEGERLESMFSVSTNTGDVMVNSALDHDFAAYVNLTVYVSFKQPPVVTNASDFAEEATFNPRSAGYLIINVIDDNSNAPIFAAPWTAQQPELSYQMLEELPVGSVLTQMMASDADSKISHFKIEPQNEYFELTSPQSGVIVNRKLIDYDSLMSQTFRTPGSHHRSSANSSQLAALMTNSMVGNNIIQFNVYVYDSGLPQLSAKATVSVEILPINDWDCKFEQPIYDVRVRENTQPDTLVVQVRANDLDFGEQHNSIRYHLVGEHKDLFNIDQRTGLVTVSTRGTIQLDRERLSQSTFSLTVVGRDEPNGQQFMGPITSKSSRNQPQLNTRTCSATIRVHVDDVNDNPPLFSQKLYEVTAYDTDAIDVPLVNLIIRDDDSYNNLNSQPNTLKPSTLQASNNFRILAGNIHDSFNITNSGLIYATKPLNATLASSDWPVQLRVQVKQQSPSQNSGVLTSFTDECLVRINFVKMNRYGPEWRLETLKSVAVEENAKPGTLVTQLRCSDRDHDQKSPAHRLMDTEPTNDRSAKIKSASSPIRYWIKENGSNVMETSEFRLDPLSGNLFTRVELDREVQEFYQLTISCEDDGKPQSLESITPLFVAVLDVDDNKPEFLGTPIKPTDDAQARGSSRPRNGPKLMVRFAVEEHQGKGLAVGELKAIDKDIDSVQPINYCILEGNEFQEFTLDRVTGILYTNQSLDRERQSGYDLIVKAINDGSSCQDHMSGSNLLGREESNSTYRLESGEQRDLAKTMTDNAMNKRLSSKDIASLLLVKVDVLDINDNAPAFRRPVYRAGVHHRSLMNTMITQVAAVDPDSGLNGTLSYKISEILMYKTAPVQQHSSSRKYDVINEQHALSKPIKLIQFPFKVDQQGNLYTQQLLTQYQLMSMFVLQIEANEQAEPWRSATTKLEIYVYETSSQIKMRINLHPRLVETYRPEIETLLSNATRYTAIINRARSYHGTLDSVPSTQRLATNKLNQVHRGDMNSFLSVPTNTGTNGDNGNEPSFSNIHLIFVDNFRIVNPSLVMEKFDLTSAQLFTPQLLSQSTGAIQTDFHHRTLNGDQRHNHEQYQRQQINEVSSLIDKIALASVQAAEYQASTAGSSSSLAGIDWLESPSVLLATMCAILTLIGLLTCLIGCCCTSRIKDHIVKVAMNKLVEQQNLQAKINERVLASANESVIGNQEYLLQQGGLMSSFDATKGCISNNHENMSILQRAMESGEYIDPNYTTLNGRINMGAHHYDASELDQQQHHHELANGKLANGSHEDTISISGNEIEAPHGDLSNGHMMKQPKLITNGLAVGNSSRQRQQIPNNN